MCLDRLTAPEARRLVRRLLKEGGSIKYSSECPGRMQERGMTSQDIRNVLRGGSFSEPEWENGRWRYRVQTHRMVVIAEIESEELVVAITCWRKDC